MPVDLGVLRKKFEQYDKLNLREGLIIAYIDDTSSFEELSETDSSLTIHQLNLYLFLVEIYKTISHLCCSFIKLALVERIPYNLTSLNELCTITDLPLNQYKTYQPKE